MTSTEHKTGTTTKTKRGAGQTKMIDDPSTRLAKVKERLFQLARWIVWTKPDADSLMMLVDEIDQPDSVFDETWEVVTGVPYQANSGAETKANKADAVIESSFPDVPV